MQCWIQTPSSALKLGVQSSFRHDQWWGKNFDAWCYWNCKFSIFVLKHTMVGSVLYQSTVHRAWVDGWDKAAWVSISEASCWVCWLVLGGLSMLLKRSLLTPKDKWLPLVSPSVSSCTWYLFQNLLSLRWWEERNV